MDITKIKEEFKEKFPYIDTSGYNYKVGNTPNNHVWNWIEKLVKKVDKETREKVLLELKTEFNLLQNIKTSLDKRIFSELNPKEYRKIKRILKNLNK